MRPNDLLPCARSSLKTEDKLRVVSAIPADRLLLETGTAPRAPVASTLTHATRSPTVEDAPWCEIRPSHAGFRHVQTALASVKKERWSAGMAVKGRNEPANLRCGVRCAASVRPVRRPSA